MDMILKITFFYCVVFFCLSGDVLFATLVEEDTCPSSAFNVTEGSILMVKDSKKEANASVFASLNVSTSAECRLSCCMKSNCSIYMFLEDETYQRKLHANCFLVHCDPVQKCKYRNLSGCEVGAKFTRSPPTPEQIPPFSTTIPTPEVSVVSTQVTTSIPNSVVPEPSVVSAMMPEASEAINNTIPQINQNPDTTQPISTALNTAPPTPPLQQDTTEEKPTTGVIKPKETFHFVGSKNIPDFDSKHSHTNTASLVIALIFGIVFLAASVVLLGRRWWESFRRRRAFSKVDYLLNGV